jgi:hypothetical protein
VLLRNRRIGCSMSGVAQFIASKGTCGHRCGVAHAMAGCMLTLVVALAAGACLTATTPARYPRPRTMALARQHAGIDELRTWSERGYAAVQSYDQRLSDWLAIPRSVKTTCVKPSGTVSLLAGATPGMHYPEARYYLRRVRVGKDHEVVEPLRRAGYVCC